MVPPANISGALLLVLMKSTLLQHVPVSLEALVETLFPHLCTRTTSVKQVKPVVIRVAISIQTVIPCGTVRGVVPLAPVAPSTHHHGSM